MQSEIRDFKDFLRKSLAEKIESNPRFSLRALAQRSGLSASHISRAMSGEAKVSPRAAYKIATGLGLSPSKIQEAIRLASLEKLDVTAKEKILGKSQKNLRRKTLNLELFEIISDWHYFAIYELVKAQPLKSSPAWIAKRLGLSLLTVKISLDKLERCQFIKKSSRTSYETESDEGIYAGNDVPHVAIKSHHRQVLQKAIDAIDTPVNDREFQSIQFAFDRKQMKSAQQKIRRFIEEFESEFTRQGAEDIYQMNLQLFSLTKEEKK